ncbi:MAG: heavy-metal-associated domain-containing protein [Lachnospiraceae bacterium]|nr:heavy-metal-associated domain-containing protein [Lachnospiraceae bacterium]
MYKTTVSVEGMMCSMCEAHINEAIRKAFPQARKVKSSHTKGISSFISEEEADKAKLAEAIEATGYQFISAASEPYEKKKLFGIF